MLIKATFLDVNKRVFLIAWFKYLIHQIYGEYGYKIDHLDWIIRSSIPLLLQSLLSLSFCNFNKARFWSVWVFVLKLLFVGDILTWIFRFCNSVIQLSKLTKIWVTFAAQVVLRIFFWDKLAEIETRASLDIFYEFFFANMVFSSPERANLRNCSSRLLLDFAHQIRHRFLSETLFDVLWLSASIFCMCHRANPITVE